MSKNKCLKSRKYLENNTVSITYSLCYKYPALVTQIEAYVYQKSKTFCTVKYMQNMCKLHQQILGRLGLKLLLIPCKLAYQHTPLLRTFARVFKQLPKEKTKQLTKVFRLCRRSLIKRINDNVNNVAERRRQRRGQRRRQRDTKLGGFTLCPWQSIGFAKNRHSAAQRRCQPRAGATSFGWLKKSGQVQQHYDPLTLFSDTYLQPHWAEHTFGEAREVGQTRCDCFFFAMHPKICFDLMMRSF